MWCSMRKASRSKSQTLGGQCLSDEDGIIRIPNIGPLRYDVLVIPPDGEDLDPDDDAGRLTGLGYLAAGGRNRARQRVPHRRRALPLDAFLAL